MQPAIRELSATLLRPDTAREGGGVVRSEFAEEQALRSSGATR